MWVIDLCLSWFGDRGIRATSNVPRGNGGARCTALAPLRYVPHRIRAARTGFDRDHLDIEIVRKMQARSSAIRGSFPFKASRSRVDAWHASCDRIGRRRFDDANSIPLHRSGELPCPATVPNRVAAR
ncbi:hypothetical protein N6G02_05735 [Cupriavidus gilardii]|uniref:Uncharacterized protein n=1 Tax=Cupriavidus gilardii TaxID=82541 RepID=A0ABY4VLC0_9BURK|nr:hypothetical protein [Cupriavidus gilardii]QQE08601.1 hypothetical protein IC580_20645 [Cupriavidus sp. ISTL7]MCT9070438.1 hypothetical protein [Cupriavidus gilardii]MCT9115621.1 hypothetical protein [Cupriavidus gilardii]QKS61176.1 hypothetical protein FOB47_04475 [Cupriavidus gilardii]USE77947.1 hypothetical protein NDR89_02545 [Cupriavidus gilardii]